MFCTKCGAQHPDGTNFCTVCGNRLRIPEAAVEVPEAPVAVPEAAPETVEEPIAVPEEISEPVPEEISEPVSEASIAEPAPEEVPVPSEPEAAEPAPVEAPEQPTAAPSCKKCGAPMAAGSNFCLNCGTYQDEAAPEKKKKGGKKLVLIIVAAVLALALIVVGGYFLVNELSYNSAMTLIEEKDYDAAIEKLESLKGYRDSDDLADELRDNETDYEEAAALLESGDLDGAAGVLEGLADYADSADILMNIHAYQDALALAESCDYEGAKDAFAALDDFYDSAEMADTGVELIRAQHLMDFAAKEDLAGYEAIDPGVTSLDEAGALALRANLYQQAAEVFTNDPDSAEQANECLYQSAVLLLELDDFDGALALREYMDDATAQRFDTSYASYCGDSTLWDSLLSSHDLFDTMDYRPALEEMIAELESLLDEHYENEAIPEALEAYITALKDELSILDEDGYITDWVVNYQALADQEYALASLNTLASDGTYAESFNNNGDVYLAKSTLEEMLIPQFEAEYKTDGTGEYTNYFVIVNSSEYAFTLEYFMDCYSADTYVSTTDSLYIEVAAGATVEVPVYLPDDPSIDTFYPLWYCNDISLNGELLPGQE